jgi:nucleoside-diphosphate-sugar epimerase
VKVLVTGGAGYIGSVLTQMLLERGDEVVVVDRFFFGPTLEHLKGHPSLTLLEADVRSLDASTLRAMEAVVDLAAISNDPAGELDPEKTWQINCEARTRVARMAKQTGVARYVLASTCSVYGFQDGVLEETSPTNPLTTYAQANLEAEGRVLALAGNGFSPTVLRQATVYGLSPRMRFDLAINGMTLGVFQRGRIPVLRDGTQWRPMVHIRDTCRAFLAVLEADAGLVGGEIFNVGSDEQNFQILPLAQRVSEAVGVPFQHEWYGDPDHRSYQVGFAKIEQTLGYKTERGPEHAAREIYSALEEGTVQANERTRTVEWYRRLIERGEGP